MYCKVKTIHVDIGVYGIKMEITSKRAVTLVMIATVVMCGTKMARRGIQGVGG